MKKKYLTNSNKKQKSFLATLHKSITQAQSAKKSIQLAITIGVKDEAACLNYIQALDQYTHDAQRMAMQCTLAYGEGPKTIATEVLKEACVN